jgi:bifunctional non-homologous end joining protein LigD
MRRTKLEVTRPARRNLHCGYRFSTSTHVQRKSPFIIRSSPVRRDNPPVGHGWLHEVKFDGYRVQLHKDGQHVTIFSKNGADFTNRFKPIEQALLALPAKFVVIDGEIVASDEEGHPNFYALHTQKIKDKALCVWCFDLLFINGKDLRPLPLIERKTRLASLLKKSKGTRLRFSESFDDAEKLLASCEVLGLEGIVSKKKDAPYRSGRGGWIKVKTATWRDANKHRHKLFQKQLRSDNIRKSAR